MKFTAQLWDDGTGLLKRMVEHPFNRDLAAGTLPEATFCNYLQQDELYIKDYTRTLLCLAKRSDDDSLKSDLLEFADDGYVMEKEMHETFFKRYGIEPVEQMSLSCYLYSGFLSKCARESSVSVALAALLPCFWFYWKVGVTLLECSCDNNPYRAWIDLYSGDEFEGQVQRLLNHVDRYANSASIVERKAMKDAFTASALLELAFWDGLYRMSDSREPAETPLACAY